MVAQDSFLSSQPSVAKSQDTINIQTSKLAFIKLRAKFMKQRRDASIFDAKCLSQGNVQATTKKLQSQRSTGRRLTEQKIDDR